uniref:Reverse transcriptase zinc-binding domain-containing protein n=1 Tax=Octopus bimaculoides TaxID=37653 RepID=A0A0L8GSY7_OCTBM
MKLTWTDLWWLESFRISFLLQTVYNTLTTPTNLHRKGLSEDQQCRLCGERSTLAHILAEYRVALSQGRYKWHHNRVLTTLAHTWE